MKKFTESHEWIEVQAGIGTVGVTHHAQKELGDIVYIELPSVGVKIAAGDEVAVLESTKAAADVYSPVSGEIIQVNNGIVDETEKVNQAPEGEGWLFKVKLNNTAELEALMDDKGYQTMLKGN